MERCLEDHQEELVKNGYKVLRGNLLKEFKIAVKEQFAPDIYVGTKITHLKILNKAG